MYCWQNILMFSCGKSDTRRTWTEWIKCFISTSLLNMRIWGFLPMKTRKYWSVYSSCRNKYFYISRLSNWLKQTGKPLCSLFTGHLFLVLGIWESQQRKNPHQLQWAPHTACKSVWCMEPQTGAGNSLHIAVS